MTHPEKNSTETYYRVGRYAKNPDHWKEPEGVKVVTGRGVPDSCIPFADRSRRSLQAWAITHHHHTATTGEIIKNYPMFLSAAICVIVMVLIPLSFLFPHSLPVWTIWLDIPLAVMTCFLISREEVIKEKPWLDGVIPDENRTDPDKPSWSRRNRVDTEVNGHVITFYDYHGGYSMFTGTQFTKYAERFAVAANIALDDYRTQLQTKELIRAAIDYNRHVPYRVDDMTRQELEENLLTVVETAWDYHVSAEEEKEKVNEKQARSRVAESLHTVRIINDTLLP